MVLGRDERLGAVFPDQEPQEAPDIRRGRVRDVTPTELDRIYTGLNVAPDARAQIEKEKRERNSNKPSLAGRLGGAISGAFHAYENRVSKPFAEGLTLLAQQILPGESERERLEISRVMQAWRDGDGLFSKLGALTETLSAERDGRKGFFRGEKLIGEILGDPLTWTGWGLMGKIPLLGKVLGPIEMAYIKGSNQLVNAGIKGVAVGLRQVPGVRGLARLNTRSVAAKQAERAITLARMSDITTFNRNEVGGFKRIIESMQIDNFNGRPLDRGVAEARGGLMRMLDDLEAWTTGSRRYVFDKKGEIASVKEITEQGRRRITPASWSLFMDEMENLTTQDAARQLSKFVGRMVHDSKATQIIEERARHSKIVRALVDDSMLVQQVAPSFQRGKLGIVNKALAELVLGFQTYGPFNVLEDGFRSVIGGSMVRELDDDIALTLMGATSVSMPTTLLENMASDIAAVTGRADRGIVAEKLAGYPVLSKGWTILGNWSIQMSKNVSGRLRRGYVFSRANHHLNEEMGKVLKQALRGSTDAAGVRDFVGNFGKGIPGLDGKTRRTMQQLALGLIGVQDVEAIRQAGRVAATSNIKAATLDKIVADTMGDFLPKSRHTIRSLYTTGEKRLDRLDDIIKQIGDEELNHMVLTEPDHAAEIVKWLGAEIGRMNPSNREELGQMLAMLANYSEQLMNLPSAVTSAMLDTSPNMSPAALKHLWGQIEGKIGNIRRTLANEDLKTKIATKFRDAGEDEIATRFENFLQRVNDTYDALELHRQTWFAGGDDIADDILLQFEGHANPRAAAWNAFGEEKHRLVGSHAKDAYEDMVEVLRLGGNLHAQAYDPATRQVMQTKLDELLKAATNNLGMKQPYRRKMEGLQRARAQILEQFQKGGLGDEAEKGVLNAFESLATMSERMPVELRAQLQSARDKAWKKAIDDYHAYFVNYDDTLAFDDVAQALMPFWRYESRRWPTMARFMVEKPFMGRAFLPDGYYFRATDEGYIHDDFFGMQVAPTRGTILGALRRLYGRDYPTQHPGWLGRAEGIQQNLERMGFYPGVWQAGLTRMVARTIGGGKGGGFTADFGEDLPASLQTLVAATTVGAIEAEQALAKVFGHGAKQEYYASTFHTFRDTVNDFFPSRYREYYENIYLATRYGMTREEVEADPNNHWMLSEAAVQIAWRQVISEQSSLTRYRPNEFTEMRDKITRKQAELTGLSVEEIKQMQQAGKRVEDAVPLSRLERSQLTNMRVFDLVSSVYRPLGESQKEMVMEAQRLYYDKLDDVRDKARNEQAEDDNDLNLGLISGKEWREAYKIRWANVNHYAKALKDDPEFQNVPFDEEGRRAFREMFNMATPLKSPVDMVLDEYYSLDPSSDTFTDPTTGDTDWNKFFRLRENTLRLLPRDVRQEVDAYLVEKDSPGMKEFREGRKFMSVYWDLERYLPIWFRSLGLSQRADMYLQWKAEYKQAYQDALIAQARGADPTAIQRMLSKPQFRTMQQWEGEYRELLRNPATVGRVPWADTRIPAFYNKFFKEV